MLSRGVAWQLNDVHYDHHFQDRELEWMQLGHLCSQSCHLLSPGVVVSRSRLSLLPFGISLVGPGSGDFGTAELSVSIVLPGLDWIVQDRELFQRRSDQPD